MLLPENVEADKEAVEASPASADAALDGVQVAVAVTSLKSEESSWPQ